MHVLAFSQGKGVLEPVHVAGKLSNLCSNFPQKLLALKLPPQLLQDKLQQLGTSPEVTAVTYRAGGTLAPSSRPPGWNQP